MKCPICQAELLWDSDCGAEEAGYSVEGTLSFYHCENCGADLEILSPHDYKEENT